MEAFDGSGEDSWRVIKPRRKEKKKDEVKRSIDHGFVKTHDVFINNFVNIIMPVEINY